MTNTGAIPVEKLVPRLPAVEKGLITRVNYSDFPIDKQSIGSIIEGLSSKTCNLESMRVSIATLKTLDNESCHSLGAFLHRKKIRVDISQIADSNDILRMFRILDDENKGYLTRNEFEKAWHIFKFQFTSYYSSIEQNSNKNKEEDANSHAIIISEDDSSSALMNRKNSSKLNIINNSNNDDLETTELMNAVFDRMAIRKLDSYGRSRIYFMDFYDSFTAIKQKYQTNFDCTSIDFPLHFIFYYLVNCVKNYYLKPNEKDPNLIKLAQLIHLPQNKSEFAIVLNNNLIKLFTFSIAMKKETQLLKMQQYTQNILVTSLIAHLEITNIIKKRKASQNDLKMVQLTRGIFWFLFKLTLELLKLPSISNVAFMMSKCKLSLPIVRNLRIVRARSRSRNISFRDVSDGREDSLEVLDNSSDDLEVQVLNCLELAILVKNFEYFALFCRRLLENETISTQKMTVIMRRIIDKNVFSSKDKTAIAKFGIEFNCIPLVSCILGSPSMKSIFNDATNNTARQLVYHCILVNTSPQAGLFFCFVFIANSMVRDRCQLEYFNSFTLFFITRVTNTVNALISQILEFKYHCFFKTSLLLEVDSFKTV